MSEYRRWYVEGGTVFFTVVTYHRMPIFASDDACRILGDVMRVVRRDLHFETVAAVLLPDHLHTIWTLPRGDADYSTRWRRIKRDFTVRWLAAGGAEANVTSAKRDAEHEGFGSGVFMNIRFAAK